MKQFKMVVEISGWGETEQDALDLLDYLPDGLLCSDLVSIEEVEMEDEEEYQKEQVREIVGEELERFSQEVAERLRNHHGQ